MTEAITWFAWHRREDRDAHLYEDEAARRTVIEFVCSALMPDSARGIQTLMPESAPKAAANRSHNH